ncbi:MAG: DUF2231 domain-containing protein [Candidatus Halalkalibacterium sp. M3_1C_030]|jgi:uncharacterized membrane protein
MELIPDWAPNIHPMVIHFPIALLVVAAGMNLLTFFIPEKWWDEWKNTILYGLGAITAIIVYFTGQSAADTVFLPTEAQSVLNHHADWALWTVWYFGLYALGRIALHWYERMSRFSLRILAFALALPGLFFLYETGDHGAQLVFGYGAGTGQLLQQDKTTSVATDSLTAETGTTFTIQENGNWSWDMGPNAVSSLLENFHWLEGSIQDLQPTVVKSSNNYLLQLSGDSLSNLFTGHNSFQNVQVDYYLDLSDFEGEIELVNHVRDADNYDFVTLRSNGTITQGRLVGGNRKIFGEESYATTGMLFVRTVVNDTHFRAYINKEMAVHGHGDAPEAGSVGLKINGSGTLLLRKMSLTQL